MTARRMPVDDAKLVSVDDGTALARGLCFGFAFSLPLWGAMIALAQLVL